MGEWLRSRSFRTSLIVLVILALGAAALRVGTSDSSSVDFRDPTIWLRNAATGDVVKVNATTGDVMASVAVANPGEAVQIEQVGSGAVVLNRSVGEFSRIDPALLEQANIMTLEVDNRTAFVIEGDRGFLVEPTTAHRVDPATLAIDSQIDVEAPKTPVVDRDGVLWFLDSERGSVKRLEIDQVDTRSDPLDDVDDTVLVTVRGMPYVVQGASGQVGRIDGGGLERSACLAEVRPNIYSGTEIGSAHELVMVVDDTGGELEVADVASGDCDSVELTGQPGTFGTPIEQSGSIFVPDFDRTVVHIVDAATKERVREVSLLGAVPQGSRFELVAKDGIMWFNDPLSAQAGVMSANRVLRRIQKTTAGIAGSGDQLITAGDSDGEVVASSESAQSDQGVTGGDTVSNGDGGSDGGDDGDSGDGTEPTDGPDPGTTDVEQELLDDLPVVSPITPAASADELIANFTFSDGTVAVGEEVFFTDASTGGPTNWAWDFNDGNVATGPEVSHAWTAPGIYTVRLDIENESAVASTSVAIEVVDAQNRVPQADFEFTQSTVEVGEPVTFTDTSTGEPTSLVWDFGDGHTGEGSVFEHVWDEVGTFTVTLTASNDNGESTSTAVIEVVERIEEPISVPIASATQVTVGQSIFFTNASTGNPTSYEWDFGDGETDLGDAVRHSYGRDGIFTVTLTVSNSLGSDSQSLQVTVVDPVFPPDARFVQSSDGAENGQEVSFTSTSTNEPTAFTWDFGDGSGAEGPNVTHSWSSPGVYQVTLSVSNSAGFDSVTKSIRIVPNLPPPSAGFEFLPDTVTAGDPVSFVDTSTGGAVSEWLWDFGDGTTGAAVANPTHIFDVDGTYSVSLTVSNIAGTDTLTRTVTVLPPPPVAGITFAPLGPATGETVQFTDGSAGGAATSWTWDFGDGSPLSTEQNPTHVYADVGTYEVKLRVENAGGSDTAARMIAVSPPPPIPDFSVGPVTAGEPAVFTNLTVGTAPIAYTWTFGDGTAPATATNPSHVFAAAGTYTVTLQATDPGGTESISRDVVVVNPPPPVANFTASALTINQGESITFTDTSTNATSLSWTFESGTPATSVAAVETVSWSVPGSYLVTLEATNLGGSASRQASITVLAVPDPVPSFTFASAGGTDVQFTNTSTNAIPTGYTWNIDGVPSSSAVNPLFTFGAGSRLVSLIACNSIGVCRESAPQAVVIIGGNFTEVTNLLQVSFSSAFNPCGGGSCAYSWDFGDGVGTSTVANPSYTYLAAGTYTVSVTVTGPVNTLVRSHAVTVVE